MNTLESSTDEAVIERPIRDSVELPREDIIREDEIVVNYRVVRTSELKKIRYRSDNGTRYVICEIPEAQYSRVVEVKKVASA